MRSYFQGLKALWRSSLKHPFPTRSKSDKTGSQFWHAYVLERLGVLLLGRPRPRVAKYAVCVFIAVFASGCSLCNGRKIIQGRSAAGSVERSKLFVNSILDDGPGPEGPKPFQICGKYLGPRIQRAGHTQREHQSMEAPDTSCSTSCLTCSCPLLTRAYFQGMSQSPVHLGRHTSSSSRVAFLSQTARPFSGKASTWGISLIRLLARLLSAIRSHDAVVWCLEGFVWQLFCNWNR